MSIEPDEKDWTWVIERSCDECGFDASVIDVAAVPRMLCDISESFAQFLSGGRHLARRPAPDTWSALEYGCHVRDCMRIFDERLQLMLTRNDPMFPNWDQDDAAVQGRYGEQDSSIVAGELLSAATDLANRFSAVSGPQWERTGRRSNGSLFTTDTLARYFIHDPVHHWWDVTGERAC
ncbi:DinB family protein [Gordonia sp. CPCC 205333]|uniref:DinB family protein n=1 Tax=Gordonia sp. CPCC 205333 TaxID=3140790 RepID=UPI003AF3C0EC